MNMLCDTHQRLLAALAKGAVDTPIHHKTAATLIKQGLLTASPVERGPGRYAITQAGRAAIGLMTITAGPPLVAAPTKPLKGKLALLADLLARLGGVRIDELMAATGWQAHSVRGAIASERTDAGRVYRIMDAGQP